MAEDLDLSSDEYSIALVVFFVTYVLFEAPSNMVRSTLVLSTHSISIVRVVLHRAEIEAFGLRHRDAALDF